MTVREKIGDAARAAAPQVRHGHEQVFDTIRRVAERCAERAHAVALPLAAAPVRRAPAKHSRRGKAGALATAGSPIRTVRTVVHHRSSILRSIAFVVLLALLACWAFWVYVLPAIPGGGLAKRGLTWGFHHIDCTSSTEPTPDPGLAGLAWSIGHGVRTVAGWDPQPQQIDDAVTAAARATGRAYAAFQAGLGGDGSRPMLPAEPAEPDVASQVSTGCCATAPSTGTRSASLTTPGGLIGLAHAQAAVTDGTLTGERLVRFVAEGIVENTPGNPAAVNPTAVRGSRAVGLWQVMIPLHADLFAGRDPKDPVASAHAGALLLERQGWGAWDDSHPGAWKAHEVEARAALAAVHAGTGGTVTAASCVTVPLPGAPGADSTGIVAVARRFLGTPYVWGGEEPGGFDCSGFTSYVWAQMGVTIPRTAEQQRLWATPVSPGQVQAGDLVFFQSRPGAEAHHVGLYVGDGRMIAAPKRGDVVKEQAVYGGEVITYGRVTGTRGSA